jgi:hypothetical protein
LVAFRARRPPVAVLVTVALVACSAPQVAAFRDWPLGFALFAPGPSCAINLPEIREYRAAFGSTAGYYACLRRQAWTHPPTLVHAAGKLDTAGIAWAAVLALSVVMLSARAGLGLVRPRRSAIMRS